MDAAATGKVRWRAVVSVPAVLVALAVLGYLLHRLVAAPAGGQAVGLAATQCSGPMELRHASQSWGDLRVLDTVSSGDAIHTGAAAHLKLVEASSAVEIQVDPLTDVEVVRSLRTAQPSYKLLVRLTVGRLLLSVPTSATCGNDVIVQAPAFVAASSGGSFAVRLDAAANGEVGVLEGSVRADAGPQAVQIGAGMLMRLRADDGSMRLYPWPEHSQGSGDHSPRPAGH